MTPEVIRVDLSEPLPPVTLSAFVADAANDLADQFIDVAKAYIEHKAPERVLPEDASAERYDALLWLVLSEVGHQLVVAQADRLLFEKEASR